MNNEPGAAAPSPKPGASEHEKCQGTLLFRELQEPAEVVALLRLRHRIYFEEHRYGPLKPLQLDLTVYDPRSRLFGIFHDDTLAGGVRIVFRDEQRLGPALRAVHAVAHARTTDAGPRLLPSEEAFSLAELGPRRALVDAEVGRLAMAQGALGKGMLLRVMIAILAALHLARVRFYLYSCAVTLAARYARVANPRWRFEHDGAAGIASDDFPFPKPTLAAVAAVEDSPYLEDALHDADELARTGAICLGSRIGAGPAEER